MTNGTIVVSVWGKDWCDEEFCVNHIYGFSYEAVTDMMQSLKEQFDYLLEEHRECDVEIKANYTPAVYGNYPPPNEESEAYWDFEIIKVVPFEEVEHG